MSKKKNSFVLYYDQQPTFELLTNEEAGKLIKSIFNYVQGKEVDKTFYGEKHLQFAFLPIQATLDRDKIKYEEKCIKNAENVNKRWNKEKAECDCIPINTNHTDSDSYSESNNDKDSDSGSESVNDEVLVKKEIAYKTFDVIYNLYPDELAWTYNTEKLFELYLQLLNGKEHNNQWYQFSVIEIEEYTKNYIEYLKNNDKQGVTLENFLDTGFIEYFKYMTGQ